MGELFITSPDFEHEGLIPKCHTGFGEDISPELHLSGVARQAESLAVIMDDLDHPVRVLNHWLIWNLPVHWIVPSNIPPGKTVEILDGAVQGRGWGKYRYRGPKPPFRWSHRYCWTVYALDCRLELAPKARKKELLQAMEGHILQQAELIGYYTRRT